MKLAGNTVLITGGASGIGRAMAERFIKAGSKVLVCGRRSDVLRAFQTEHPQASIYECDVSLSKERVRLIETVSRDFPSWNVLVNNAGIQRRVNLREDEDFDAAHQEIAINLEAPVHLSRLAAAVFADRPSAIVQVTSGLAFSPLANVPVYCATKAALRSFTLSLRAQLRGTATEVIEIIPPAVQTDLGGKGLHDFGAPLAEFADSVMNRLDQGDIEIAYGFAEQASKASRQELDAIFSRMNPA